MPDVPAPVSPTAPPSPDPGAVKPTAPVLNGKPTDEKPAPTGDDRLQQLEVQTKRLASERMKLAHEARKQREELAKEKEGIAAQKAEFEAWKAREADRKRNPVKYLKESYGDDWYDKATQWKLNGLPTPDLIASEVDDKVSALERKLQEQEERWQKQLQEKEQAQANQEQQAYLSNAVSYAEANADKYPMMHAAGAVQNIAGVIDAHFRATTRQNENGEWQPGELLTAEEACEKLEKYIEELATKAAEAKAKKTAATPAGQGQQKPAPASVITQPQRRTLSTDMSAGQGQLAPPATESERMKRAIAAWEAAQARNA